jgi:hypothetical protein
MGFYSFIQKCFELHATALCGPDPTSSLMSLCALASADTNMAASPARADRDTDEKGVIL